MLSKYFTAILTVLILLNLAILIFIVLEIGWQQIVAVPSFVVDGIKDPSILRDPSRFLNRRPYLSDQGRAMINVAGLIDDPNVKLVCSDESFAVAASKVRPSVVNISCESISPMPRSSAATRFDDPFPDLATLGGIGSGIIVHPDGYILTCNHIIANASNIYVVPFGPSANRYHARVIATDKAFLNFRMLVRLIGGQCGQRAAYEAEQNSQQDHKQRQDRRRRWFYQ